MNIRPELMALCRELREYRAQARLTQGEMAEALGLSRKTYNFFETHRWLPTVKHLPHMLKSLHSMSPRLGEAFATACGSAVEDVALVLPVAAPPETQAAPPLDPKHAKLAVEAALYAAAEQAEVSPKVMRAIAALLLGRLAEAGVGMAQAAALAKSAAAERARE
jgi:DNA-binding XRE family transcriptional regulator